MLHELQVLAISQQKNKSESSIESSQFNAHHLKHIWLLKINVLIAATAIIILYIRYYIKD